MGRSYRLLCPIARSLDRVGDRWTLLILRDLHAGPMRFGELLAGLPGLASNLLTSRLEKLQADGLLIREGSHFVLTDLGRQTDGVLWELARLGMLLPAEEDLKRPGHLRLAAITLQNALRRVVAPTLTLRAELVLDGESFVVDVLPGELPVVRYGVPESADVVVRSSYEPLMAAAAGELPLGRFRSEHVHLQGAPEAMEVMTQLMTKVMLEAFAATP